ncbi:MAG: hypothetical protein SNJ67_13940 [Chloracidobacterium sp.]|uniref:Transmembrane protein n=1 Tax=Chloracidobacterium validum TaxID=2821543 RepID=A0ABX8BDP7_9BACT|nr:hypothetical protein [Chloracidobacterium validum]QUW03195.1 hypothetical protein J8C06_01755 [Chloracidobacterium validum]
MRAHDFWLQLTRLGWRQSFGWLFLGWLFLDLCVVHLLCPQYAAGELFGCAVPAVVAVPSEAPLDASLVVALPSTPDSLADKSALAHSCFWNTSSLLKPAPFALPPRQSHPLWVVRTHALPSPYTRLSIGAIFHPPRLT